MASSSAPENMNIYLRMLKLKIPIKVIKSKMKRQGIDPKLLDKCMVNPSTSDQRIPPPELERYVKMYKIKVPMIAIKNKMRMNKIDPKKLENWLKGTYDHAAKQPPPEIADYLKMLKFGLPIRAVKHKMKMNKIESNKYDYWLATAAQKYKQERLKKEQEHKSDSNDDNILYNKHRNILNQWNINSNKLAKHTLKVNDDDQKENQAIQSGNKLFNIYTLCTAIIKVQTNRLSQVTTANYLLELINRQNSLSKSIKEHEQKSISYSTDYSDKKEQHEAVKQQRIDLQQQIDALSKKCNKTIEFENKLYQQLRESTVKKEAMDKVIENMKSSSKSCVAVIKSYNDFMENNKKYIDEINTDFKKKWEQFEAMWREWSVHDIVVWFKYCSNEMDPGKINWINVENQLKNRNITGKSLENFNNLVFELIGIHDFNIVTRLASQICILKKKYNVNNNNDEKSIKGDGKQKIPDEFLCPITKTIMQDPVMAFDGYTYERNAIESYFKIHNKSPITAANAEYVIVFPNHKLKAVIRKYIQENNIDIQQQNESCQEGVSETSYL